MARPMPKAQKLRIIDAILKVNALVLGEEQLVFVTTMPKGWIRVGYRQGVHGGRSNSYPSVDEALAAAWVALANARAKLEQS